MKKILIFGFIILFITVGIIAEGQKEGENSKKITEWEKEAQLGDFRPETDNWEEIESKAKEEGEVIVWSYSSKVFTFCKSFYKKYKIKAIPNDLGTRSLFEKLRREQAAGVYSTDVILTDGIAELYNEFVPNKSLYKFIPREVEKTMFPEAKEGHLLGIVKQGGKLVAYNTEVNKTCPIDSWWDLTREEWKNRIVVRDPLLAGSDLYFMTTFITKGDEMAAAYKEEFGEDIVLNGTDNAGYEFIKRLLNNKLILMQDSNPVASAVGTKRQKTPPLGITGPSKLKLNEEANLAFDMAWDLKPFSMYVTTALIGISKYAKNPNAAKLMIKWIYGDKNAGEGYTPFKSEGNWSVRSDVIDTVNRFKINELKVWRENANAIYNSNIYLKDFWVQNM